MIQTAACKIISENENMFLSRRVLEITSARKTTCVPVSRIIYIESDMHQCLIHTDLESLKCCEKLNSIFQRMPDNFSLCHKSYLVNMDRIYKLEGSKTVLENGDRIPISRARYEEFRKEFFSYIEKKEREK